MENDRNYKTRGLKFEYLTPHLSESFKLYLAQDVKNIIKCFDLSENAADKFKEALVKDITKNYLKPLPKVKFFKKLLYNLL